MKSLIPLVSLAICVNSAFAGPLKLVAKDLLRAAELSNAAKKGERIVEHLKPQTNGTQVFEKKVTGEDGQIEEFIETYERNDVGDREVPSLLSVKQRVREHKDSDKLVEKELSNTGTGIRATNGEGGVMWAPFSKIEDFSQVISYKADLYSVHLLYLDSRGRQMIKTYQFERRSDGKMIPFIGNGKPPVPATAEAIQRFPMNAGYITSKPLNHLSNSFQMPAAAAVQ